MASIVLHGVSLGHVTRLRNRAGHTFAIPKKVDGEVVTDADGKIVWEMPDWWHLLRETARPPRRTQKGGHSE